MAEAEVVFIDQAPAADDEQAAVLRAALNELERLVELSLVHAGDATNLVGVLERAPAALLVERREAWRGARRQVLQRGIDDRIVRGSVERELGKVLISGAMHEPPR